MVPHIVRGVLVAAVALQLTLVAFNNLTDYESNFRYVDHVLRMDTTFPGNVGMWRAIAWTPASHAAYGLIILWETATAAACWVGAWRCFQARRGPAGAVAGATRAAQVGLAMSLLLWLGGFIIIGGEWFLMWQSKTWNGLDPAFRNFAISGVVLLLVSLPPASVSDAPAPEPRDGTGGSSCRSEA